jgi:transcriptional antiterminator RfaH
MSPYWCCARLETKREAVAQHFLKLAGYQVYIPRVREQRLRRRRQIEVIAPLFPAYAFIVIEGQWRSARWSIGVSALIMDGMAPAARARPRHRGDPATRGSRCGRTAAAAGASAW